MGDDMGTVNLPTVLEAQVTGDGRDYIKMSNISQVRQLIFMYSLWSLVLPVTRIACTEEETILAGFGCSTRRGG